MHGILEKASVQRSNWFLVSQYSCRHHMMVTRHPCISEDAHMRSIVLLLVHWIFNMAVNWTIKLAHLIASPNLLPPWGEVTHWTQPSVLTNTLYWGSQFTDSFSKSLLRHTVTIWERITQRKTHGCQTLFASSGQQCWPFPRPHLLTKTMKSCTKPPSFHD